MSLQVLPFSRSLRFQDEGLPMPDKLEIDRALPYLRRPHVCAALVLAASLFPTAPGLSQSPPPTKPLDVLPIGMSTALTGPAADLGRGMKTGVDLAFAEHNRSRSPAQRPLHLIALDDGYEPDRCAPNMRILTEHENVLAVIGNVGTPTAIAALPIVNQTRTPFFGAYTGAGVLRKDPPDALVINFRASYAEETSAMVDALVDVAGVKPEEVAFFTQRDGYGDSGFNGGIAALTRHGLKNASAVVHARYERNTLAVESALSEILLAKTEPRALIMVGAYAPCAELIRQARALDFHPLFLNVSFVGGDRLAKDLGDSGDGVIITQVVPHIDSDVPIAKQYRRALTALDPTIEPSFCSLEGYIAGRIFCRALDSIEGTPTRQSILDALLALGRFDLGLGVDLELDPSNHQACHRVWPTVIRRGRVVPFEWSELASRGQR